MTQQAADIRAAIKAALVAGQAIENTENIFSNRTTKVKDVPALLIYTLNERAEIFDEAPRTLLRTLQLEIQIIVQDNAAMFDSLDAISEKITKIFRTKDYQTLGGICNDVVYTGTTAAWDQDGEAVTGSAVMSYDVTYYTDEVDDGSSLVPFITADTTWTPEGSTADSPHTEDKITLPEG
jgi:hypothetical protein